MNTDTVVCEGDGELLVGASRVLLRTVIAARKVGQSPEEIRENFPSLSLAQVYGAIVYYLEHQDALDARFTAEEQQIEELRAANRAGQVDFLAAMSARFAHARAQSDQSPHDEASEG
ncbi:MAG TPA: DUF433 domain-containing protein [Ktedonobacterales bacterium]